MLTVVQRGNFLSFSKEILMGVLKAQFNAVSIHPLSDTGALQMSVCLSGLELQRSKSIKRKNFYLNLQQYLIASGLVNGHCDPFSLYIANTHRTEAQIKT